MKILLLILWISVPVWAVTDTSDWSDSGIAAPSYDRILQGMDQLKKQYKDLVTLIEYGKSVEGRPLRLMVAMKKNRRFAEHPTLVMSGTTHGNEYLNIEDRLPRALLAKSRQRGNISRFLEEGGAFVFIPILNPDGFESRNRENAHGVDLNRDWDVRAASYQGFKEIETRALADELDSLTQAPYHLKYTITVDYHCCIGALLQPWGYTKDKLPDADEQKHADIEAMAERLLKIEGGTTGDILGYMPLGTTKDFYYDRYHSIAFTYEGRYKVEKDYFDKHVEWWDEMTGYLFRRKTPDLFSAFRSRIRNPFAFLAD